MWRGPRATTTTTATKWGLWYFVDEICSAIVYVCVYVKCCDILQEFNREKKKSATHLSQSESDGTNERHPFETPNETD